MENVKDAMKAMEFFKGFSDEELSILQAEMETRKVSKEDCLFTEKEEGNNIFWTIQGQFDIKKYAFPTEQIILRTEPGEPIGELSFIDGEKRSATVIAVEDAEGIVLARERFDSLREKNPELAFKLLLALSKILSFRLREMTQRFVELA